MIEIVTLIDLKVFFSVNLLLMQKSLIIFLCKNKTKAKNVKEVVEEKNNTFLKEASPSLIPDTSYGASKPARSNSEHRARRKPFKEVYEDPKLKNK